MDRMYAQYRVSINPNVHNDKEWLWYNGYWCSTRNLVTVLAVS